MGIKQPYICRSQGGFYILRNDNPDNIIIERNRNMVDQKAEKLMDFLESNDFTPSIKILKQVKQQILQMKQSGLLKFQLLERYQKLLFYYCQYEELITVSDEALRIDDNDPEILQCKALALAYLWRYDEGIKILEELMQRFHIKEYKQTIKFINELRE